MKILTAAQMREVDRQTTQKYGIPSLLLMENAGINLYLTLEDYFEDLQQQRIAILCGKGNNGGDGIVLARHLQQRGIHPDLFLLGKISDVTGDARVNLDVYRKTGDPLQQITSLAQWREISATLPRYDIIVDALLGTGITQPLQGLYAEVVSAINLSDAFVLSVDIPSGIFSDSLEGGAPAVIADVTVTFTAPKIAHILSPDQEVMGDLRIVPIGSPAELMNRPDYYVNLITRELAGFYVPRREIKAHKGNFGHVGIISGSRGKAGAAALCAGAALRAGSGLVTAYVPELVQPVVASFRPEVMTEGLPCTARGTLDLKAGTLLLDLLSDKDAAGMGPGLSTEGGTIQFVHKVTQNSPIPLLLDADALNAFEGNTRKLVNRKKQPLVITPHPGEFSRLLGQPTPKVLANRLEFSRNFAREQGLWVVLKGFRTLLATPQGEIFVCPLGNPGMATAGMGDALTGVLASLLGTYACRGMTEPQQITQALTLGIYLHSLAGDLAVRESGPEALTAGDVIDHLGKAYQELASAEP